MKSSSKPIKPSGNSSSPNWGALTAAQKDAALAEFSRIQQEDAALARMKQRLPLADWADPRVMQNLTALYQAWERGATDRELGKMLQGFRRPPK